MGIVADVRGRASLMSGLPFDTLIHYQTLNITLRSKRIPLMAMDHETRGSIREHEISVREEVKDDSVPENCINISNTCPIYCTTPIAHKECVQ